MLKKQDTEGDFAAMFMFTDGGPGHNCKHLFVQATLLAMFLLGGMDTLVVLRTAPQQSWTNPAERVMPILNIGLQGCSLSRTEMDRDFETTMRKCNGMNAIRWTAVDSQEWVKATLLQQSWAEVAPTTQEVSGVNVQPREPLADMLSTVSIATEVNLTPEEDALDSDMGAVR